MYLKIIGSLFVLGSAALIGFWKAENLNRRVQYLQELKRMAVFLQGELRYHRSTLAEAFENVSERINEPFGSFLKELAEKIQSNGRITMAEAWEEASGYLLQQAELLKVDLPLLEILGNSLGYLDITMQIEHLNFTVFQIEDVLNLAKEQWMVKGKLYRTMGVSVGALLVLLII